MDLRYSRLRPIQRRTLAAGALCLATGGIVLLRSGAQARQPAPALEPEQLAAPRSAPAATAPLRDPMFSAPKLSFAGPHVQGQARLTQGAVEANGTRHVYAEVRITAERDGSPREPRPVAMSVVLDTSGSMGGEKIQQARAAIERLVRGMRESDSIALTTYDNTTHVVQAMARVSEVRASLLERLQGLEATGGTFIPPAMEAGAEAFSALPAGTVRRVLLVSDGQDGSGISLETVQNRLRGRANEGITLSSLGIGADFDAHFMEGVSNAGRGNYVALRDGAGLGDFLQHELREAGDTALEQTVATVSLPPGWRVHQSWGAEAESSVGSVRLPVGAVFAGDTRRVLLDLELPAGAPGNVNALSVQLSYYDVNTLRSHRIPGGHLVLHTVATAAAAEASRDTAAFAEAESTAISARQSSALAAWQQGRRAEAERLTNANLQALQALRARAPTAVSGALANQAQQMQNDLGYMGRADSNSEASRSYVRRSAAFNVARARRAAEDAMPYAAE